MFGILATIASSITGLFSGMGLAAACRTASELIVALPKALEIGKVVLQGIAEVIIKVAEILEISPKDENVEEIGVKAMQKDTRPRMEDESMEDYLSYLRDEVALDKKKMLNMTEEQKIQCQAVGVSMLSEAISEKNGVEISPAFLIAMNKMRMSGDELAMYLKKFSKYDILSMDSLLEYLKGNLNDEETQTMYEVVTETERTISPDASLLDVQEKIEEYREAVNEPETLLLEDQEIIEEENEAINEPEI